MDQNENQLSPQAQEALSILRSSRPEPSTYMKTRVMARLREEGTPKGRAWLWPSVSLILGLALVLVLVLPRSQWAPEALSVQKPYMVKVDLRPMDNSDLAYAVIELEGDGIQFSSNKFNEVEKLKSLRIEWQVLIGKQYLPIVIEGIKAGPASVVVRFYDNEQRLVEKKNVQLSFGKI